MNDRADLRRERTFEQAVMVIRLVLSTLALVLVLGDSISAASIELSSTIWPLSVLAVAGAWCSIAWLITRSLLSANREENARRSTTLLGALHAGDTFGGVALAYAVGEASPGSSWVLLTVPIVVASVRFSSRAVIVTWFGVSIGYLASDQLWPSHYGVGTGAFIEQSGLLLAVAASVAVMTRWLEEGWRSQAEITIEAEQARDQLKVVQTASQSMRVSEPTEVLDVTARSAVALGFDACVVTRYDDAAVVAGDASFVPSDADVRPKTDVGDLARVELTVWTDGVGERCHSAAVVEPRTGAVVTGWRRQPITDNQATSLAQLVSHASTTIEAAHHLARARFAASRDPLTKTANRATIQAFVDRDHAGQEPYIGAIFIDIDRFKQVNDTHGHATGDQLLVSIARRIQSIAGRSALTGRYGGDEFIVLSHVADPAAFTLVAEAIRKKLAEPHALDGHEIHSSASVGVAYASNAERRQVLEWADQAAYQAKRGGRDSIVVRRSHDPAPPEPADHRLQRPEQVIGPK